MSKIVIIDDNTLIAKLYETNLTARDGHQVEVAFDGASGLRAIKQLKPDLVLLDLMMPDISGIEIIRELRADAAFCRLPILAYSGGDEEVLAAARQAGASRVVSKKESSLKKILELLNELLLPKDGAERRIARFADDEADNENEHPRKTGAASDGRVLIVEDDLLIVMVVKDIVEKAGYEPVVARDGRDAYRILAKDTNFAAGIFDVHVPFIEGPELLRYMRTEKRLMKIPVMIMTAGETLKAQLDSISAGAAVFVQKPFERKTFESMFQALVNKPI